MDTAPISFCQALVSSVAVLTLRIASSQSCVLFQDYSWQLPKSKKERASVWYLRMWQEAQTTMKGPDGWFQQFPVHKILMQLQDGLHIGLRLSCSGL